MSVTAIVGANWGDEGKGKMTDFLAESSDIVIRFQGGSNAGHTIINKFGRFSLHLIPSGIFYSNVTNILGTGVAFNPEAFMNELNDLKKNGIKNPKILISDRAEVLLPYHVLFDCCEEERRGKKKQFGSTKSGIAPFYSDKYSKIGIQVADLYNEDVLRSKINTALETKNVLLKYLYKKDELNAKDIISKLLKEAEEIKPYVCNTSILLHKALKEGKKLLVEGQLGALRDPDHGIYPFSTSSSTLAGYASVGAGIPPYEIKEIIAVVKAYSSCVGAGPFVTEIFGDEASELRDRGGDKGEYGATTGRPRRMGWLDLVATKYGCMMQGATGIALTLLDVLGYLDEIPVCTGYVVDGTITEDFPVTYKLTNAKPVYKKLKGWKSKLTGIHEFDKLPKEAKDYVKFIEDFTGVPVKWVSVGPRREDTIER